MNEKVSLLKDNAQVLQAVEFLYYDAHKLLNSNPIDEGAQQAVALLEPLILGISAELPPQIILEQIISKFQKAEDIRSKEQEIPSIYVATIGLDSVGKAEVTTHLKDKYGFEAHPLSERLIDIGLALGYQYPFDREKLREISSFIKGLLGNAVLIRFAEAIFAEINKPNRILFDGIRVPEEVKELVAKEHSLNIQTIIIAIVTGEETEEADLQERFFRSLKRGSEKDPKEFEEFKQRSLKEAFGIQKSMEFAHIIVVNRRGKKEEMLSQIDAYLEDQGVTPINVAS